MQTITLDNVTDYLVPMTMLRRDPNGVADKAINYGKVIVTKSGQPFLQISTINPPITSVVDYSDQIKALAGGVKFGFKNAKEINDLLDEEYE